MLKRLLSLYKKQQTSSRTPLEDFVTETYAAILESNPLIMEEFAEKLKLPIDDYSISTQQRFDVGPDTCIVDMVLWGAKTKTLCLIENKVNSLEGQDQLLRYSQVLASTSVNHRYGPLTKVLAYCTKYRDDKPTLFQHNQMLGNNFIYMRWKEIYEMLTKYCEATYVNDFLLLLKEQRVSQRMTLTNADLTVLRHMQETIGLVDECLSASKQEFITMFGSNARVLSSGISIAMLMEQNKAFYRYNKILGGDAWSDLKYGFDFTNSTIFVNIWSSSNHAFSHKLADIANQVHIASRQSGNGVEVYIEQKLDDYVNEPDLESVIRSWFRTSFAKFIELRDACKLHEIDWNASGPMTT